MMISIRVAYGRLLGQVFTKAVVHLWKYCMRDMLQKVEAALFGEPLL